MRFTIASATELRRQDAKKGQASCRGVLAALRETAVALVPACQNGSPPPVFGFPAPPSRPPKCSTMFHARSSLIIFRPFGAPVTPFTHVSVSAKMRLTSNSARQNRPKKCKVLSNSAQNRSKRPLNDEENCLPILTFEASTPSGAIKNAVFALRTVEKSPDSGAPRRKCFCKNATYINSREPGFGVRDSETPRI